MAMTRSLTRSLSCSITLAVLVSTSLSSSIAYADGERFDIVIVGWTSNSAFLVYRRMIEDSENPESKGISLQVTGVLDLATGKKDQYLAMSEGIPPSFLSKALALLPAETAYQSWARQRRLTPATMSFKSPDGKIEAKVLSEDGKSWISDGALKLPNHFDAKFWYTSNLTLALSKGSRVVVMGSWSPELCGPETSGSEAGTVEAFWSPNGRYIAWLSKWPGCTYSRSLLRVFDITSFSRPKLVAEIDGEEFLPQTTMW